MYPTLGEGERWPPGDYSKTLWCVSVFPTAQFDVKGQLPDGQLGKLTFTEPTVTLPPCPALDKADAIDVHCISARVWAIVGTSATVRS